MLRATAILLLSSLIFTSVAFAIDESEANKQVALVAINGTNAAVAVTSPGASQACFFTLIAFDYTTALGRLLYATLLDAKANKSPVDLSYTRNGQTCTLVQVVAR